MDLIALSDQSWVLGLIGLGVAFAIYRSIVRRPTGSPAMNELAELIHGA